MGCLTRGLDGVARPSTRGRGGVGRSEGDRRTEVVVDGGGVGGRGLEGLFAIAVDEILLLFN